MIDEFESCTNCIHSADAESLCILRLCKHAIAETKECYEPKAQPIIEPKTEAKAPRWVAEDRFVKGSYFEYPHCPKCNGELVTGQCYCSICGQHIDWDEDMKEGENR